MTRVLRLRRINKNFGKKVFIVANFVVLETERLTTQSQVALIWDVDDYKDGLTGDLGTMQVISLTQNSSVESVYDSVIISAIISGDAIPQYSLIVLNQTSTGLFNFVVS